jgi:hypothetical protein
MAGLRWLPIAEEDLRIERVGVAVCRWCPFSEAWSNVTASLVAMQHHTYKDHPQIWPLLMSAPVEPPEVFGILLSWPIVTKEK